MFKNKQILLVSLLMLFLVVPMLYLFFKTSKAPVTPPEQSVTTTSPNVDIASLENAVKESQTLDNLINLSMAYINNKMPGKSIDHLKKAIEINPKSAVAYNNLGVAYIMLGQYQNGIDACTKAIEIDSKFQLAKNNLKWGMDEKNKLLVAIQTHEKTPENKRDVSFFISYGMSYYKTGNWDKSIEIWSKIFNLEPKNTIALNNVGTAFMMKNQYDAAIELFRKAIDIDSKNQLAKNNLAWAMDEKNKAIAGQKN